MLDGAGFGRTASAASLKRVLRLYPGSTKATVAAATLVLVVLVALLGPSLVPQDPFDLAAISVRDAALRPGSLGSTGFVFWLGSDAQGRDVLSAIVYGLRTSLSVGVVAGVVALVFGTTVGLLAGYLGGWVEAVVMRIVDLMLGLPAIFVALTLLGVFGRGTGLVVLALVAVQWAYFARVARGAAMAERGRDYVTAAIALGLTPRQVLVAHVLPNALPPLIVLATLQVATAISAEATLSFLGIGLPITEPSLGLLIANGYQTLLTGEYWISVFPGLALVTLVFSVNLVGDRMRDLLDPRRA